MWIKFRVIVGYGEEIFSVSEEELFDEFKNVIYFISFCEDMWWVDMEAL